MNSIQTACKTISNLVNRATIDKLVGLEDGGGSINVQVSRDTFRSRAAKAS